MDFIVLERTKLKVIWASEGSVQVTAELFWNGVPSQPINAAICHSSETKGFPFFYSFSGCIEAKSFNYCLFIVYFFVESIWLCLCNLQRSNRIVVCWVFVDRNENDCEFGNWGFPRVRMCTVGRKFVKPIRIWSVGRRVACYGLLGVCDFMDFVEWAE